MTDPNDPAFNGLPGSGSPGLTKREYFAAMAMQGILCNITVLNNLEKGGTETASFALQQADALIAELNKEVK